MARRIAALLIWPLSSIQLPRHSRTQRTSRWQKPLHQIRATQTITALSHYPCLEKNTATVRTMDNIVLGCQLFDGTAVYPPSQSFKPYHDTSSEEASLHDDDGEDQTFLEKPEAGLKVKTRRFSSKKLRSCCVNVNASIISCVISLFTALLVVIAIFVLSPENPITIVKERLHMSGPSKPVLLHGSSGPSATKPSVKPAGALQHMHCGSTPQEARALNCVFDVMSFAWTPAACYDGALSQQVQDKTGPWIFYLDHNATQPIPSYERLTNELVVWTEHSYHVSHCNYAWERIHRAYLNQWVFLSSEGA